MGRLKGFLRGQPYWIDGGILGIVVLHFAATWLRWVPNAWVALSTADDQSLVQAVYLGMLGPAAIVAGFAGVVVVFGITASSERFKKFRAQAGQSLRRTWVASSLSGFEAVAFAIAAALLSISGFTLMAAFAFEASLFLLLHGAIRLIWILSQMIGIVRADDIVDTESTNSFKLSSLPKTDRPDS
ncbi:hypothetical protein ACTXMZ_17915 [Brachybacterium alimentarium]|uniref:hypothetical protein n=1 Tax=Brachybacterium alimentarium TaxID=47845 RepID=UPI003FD4AF32